MNAARQACRPKHQVLVLKCYPKLQKNNSNEVKANSSELSYLLYYASTRRSKLQKVGDFLDKRTTADVWKGRIGNVQVTLQILKALIEKCPRDLPLYAAAALRIFATILRSRDVAMVEESVPAFETLCAHQDPANLAADQEYIAHYDDIVHLYADFASKDPPHNSKAPVTWPVQIRFRKAGLQALKAVASSESLGSETGRQLAVIIPVVLLNVYADSGAYLRRLDSRDHDKEEHDKDQALRRRQSISTVRTNEENGERDPAAASGTTADADKLAEEEVGIIALHALRNIFAGVNRGQLRLATSAVLKFIGTHVKPHEHFEKRAVYNSWPATLLAMVCGWAPVQDRYAILVGAMETLVRSPIVEDDLERQLVLATVIEYLLSSTINFIGLSVMDVLVGLISHTLLLLQLGGSGSAIAPHHQQTVATNPDKEIEDATSSGKLGDVVSEVVQEPSHFRVELLAKVQKCMASLATHVYYTDQISDMVGAILMRLKPSPAGGVSSTAAAIEDPAAAVDAVVSSASLQEKNHVDKFFSFETARLIALDAVKNILITANTRRPDGSSASVSRGSVGVRVWEGTQWLLRDPSGKARKAYVDALITWLNLEKDKDDLKIVDDHRKKDRENDKGGLARRAVSNASHRDKSPKRIKGTFLALLHLAVYENAHQFVDSEPDLLLLHLLLTTLVNKLGLNAVRTGLPMVLRLQEEIPSIESPAAKIRIGSLVHGYLWALSMALDFETSSVGRSLHSEISRRADKGLWLQSIRVPPMPLDRIDMPRATSVRLSTEAVMMEALKPFDNREALVERIADGYSASLYSPPSSPPSSPGRSLSIASLAPQTLKPPPQLPPKVKEELMADWTKDICIANNTKDSSSASVTGSKTGTSAHLKNNYLGISIPNGDLNSMNNSPLPSPNPHRSRSRPPSAAYGLVGRFSSPNRRRAGSPSATPGSTSSVHSAVRVEDLKRVLSGSAPRTAYSIRPASHRRNRDSQAGSEQSSASDSMVSVHSLSDASFVTADPNAHSSQTSPLTSREPESPSTPAATLTPKPTNLPTITTASPTNSSHAQRERDNAFFPANVPPVPPIPVSLRDNSVSPPRNERPRTAPGGDANGSASASGARARSVKSARFGPRSDKKDGVGSRGRSGTMTSRAGKRKPDLSGFLDSIGVDGDDETGEVRGRVGKAPY